MRPILLCLALLVAGFALITACSDQPSEPLLVDQDQPIADKARVITTPPRVLAIDQEFLRALMTACEGVPEDQWEPVDFILTASNPVTKQPANFEPGETMTVELLQIPGLPVPTTHSIVVETPKNPVPTPDGCIIFRITGLSDTDHYKVDSWFPDWIEEANLFGSNFAFYQLLYIDQNNPSSDIYADWITNVIIDADGVNGPLMVTMHGGPEKPNRSYWVGDPHAPGDD